VAKRDYQQKEQKLYKLKPINARLKRPWSGYQKSLSWTGTNKSWAWNKRVNLSQIAYKRYFAKRKLTNNEKKEHNTQHQT